ncbi:hypothetical protein MKX08_001122 [Trichoderma sp. CBMAI-0020]|nr:hypothetical protein MKX08_001122 [Trichoderma sp. CBMAI-0020]
MDAFIFFSFCGSSLGERIVVYIDTPCIQLHEGSHVVAEMGLQLCHPVHQALRRTCLAATHGSEIISASVTLASHVHVARVDRVYLGQFQAGQRPFDVLEFKNVSARAVIFMDQTIFNVGMEASNERRFKSSSSAQTLKHANINIMT